MKQFKTLLKITIFLDGSLCAEAETKKKKKKKEVCAASLYSRAHSVILNTTTTVNATYLASKGGRNTNTAKGHGQPPTKVRTAAAAG